MLATLLSRARLLPTLASRVCTPTLLMSRLYGTGKVETLKEALLRVVPLHQADVKEFRDPKGKYAKAIIDEVTVEQAYGGMRDILCMVTETSHLDANEGIRFRDFTINDLRQRLPKWKKKGEEPLPEAVLWLLMTGEVPTEHQALSLTKDLHARSKLPPHVLRMIQCFPPGMHPMAQFSSAIMGLQTESRFAKQYNSMGKADFWPITLEDSLDLLARLPGVAAAIYRHTFKDGKLISPDPSLDWSGNLCTMMGFENPSFHELMRLYLSIHSDHEGGNASAHTTHLVGSTHADPYTSFSAGMCALAGPLHGLANQQVLKWINGLQASLGGKDPTEEDVVRFVQSELKAGRVIPGFGHAVLRKTDPRYMAQREFALKNLPEDPLFKIVSLCFDVIPRELGKQGKVKNPWPNVDAHSGCLLTHYGLVEEDFYTVLFGVSRALGVLASLVWDRALGLPLERPKSIDTITLKKRVQEAEARRSLRYEGETPDTWNASVAFFRLAV